MNKVIESIMVNNPCTHDNSLAQGGIVPVSDYSRATEQQRSGAFDLEEGLQATLGTLG